MREKSDWTLLQVALFYILLGVRRAMILAQKHGAIKPRITGYWGGEHDYRYQLFLDEYQQSYFIPGLPEEGDKMPLMMISTTIPLMDPLGFVMGNIQVEKCPACQGETKMHNTRVCLNGSGRVITLGVTYCPACHGAPPQEGIGAYIADSNGALYYFDK